MNTLIKITITAFLSGYLFLSYGQEAKINEGTYMRNEVNRPGIRVTLKPQPKAVKKAFKDYLKKNYDVKLDGIGFLTNKDELYAENVAFEEVSPKSMSIYAEIVSAENDDYTQMTVYGALGYDIYLAPNGRYEVEFDRMKTVVEKFLNHYLVDYYEAQVEKAAERLEDVKDETTDISSNIDDNKEEIEDLRKAIEDLRKDLEQKEKQLKDAEATYEKRMKALKSVKVELKDMR